MTNNCGKKCVRCDTGYYKVADLNDDIHGELHCDNCGHFVKANQDLDQPMTDTPNRPPLSPAAQTVLDAANKAYWLWDAMCPADADAIAAAALRAAADQVVPPALEEEFHDRNQAPPLTAMVKIRKKLLAIAAELEGVTSQ